MLSAIVSDPQEVEAGVGGALLGLETGCQRGKG